MIMILRKEEEVTDFHKNTQNYRDYGVPQRMHCARCPYDNVLMRHAES